MGGAGGGGGVELWERMAWVVERELRAKEGKSIIFQRTLMRKKLQIILYLCNTSFVNCLSKKLYIIQNG